MTSIARPPKTSARSARADMTPTDLARPLLAEELRRRRAGEDGILDTRSWRTSATASIVVAKSPAGARLSSTSLELDTVFAMLAERGLVEEGVDEGRVRASRPQLYRWSRAATDEALERYVSPKVAGGVCAAEHCVRERVAGSRYCSDTCETRMLSRVRGRADAAR